MNEIAIKTEGLSKRYSIGGPGADYGTLRDTLVDAFRAPLRKATALLKGQAYGALELNQEIWALKDVSLSVKRGEILGIIGRNGAGKSTLLKILSRITEPTEGRAEIHGRVGSLLEVGTGFHQELTGRENVFLNGAILGMRKEEIKRKFDEIVAFSEVEKFLDTPVKFYSSGMRVRLAFAVAAHLDPEILLVDEVLAVGDAAFQKKCLNKMGSVAGEGRTVMFVSHNMMAIASLCSRVVLLFDGQLAADGASSDVIEQYYKSIAEIPSGRGLSGDGSVTFISARVVDSQGASTSSVDINKSFAVEMTYEIRRTMSGTVVPNYHFNTPAGTCCFIVNLPGLKPMPPGRYVASCVIPANTMNEGSFSIDVATTTYFGDRYTVNFWENGLLMVTIRDPKEPDEFNYGFVQTVPGILRPRFEWQLKRVS